MSEKRRRRRLNKRIINGWMKNDRITRTGIYRSNKHFRIYSVNLISCRFFPRSCFPFRLLFFQWNVTRRAICWKPTAWKTHGNSGHKGFYDNYGKKNGNGNNEGLGLNQREMSRFVARWMANLLFSPRLFNKNWKNHVLYLIAADLINVAICGAHSFFSLSNISNISGGHPLSPYFFIFLHRFNHSIRWPLWCNESQSRFPPRDTRLCPVETALFSLGEGIWKIS